MAKVSAIRFKNPRGKQFLDAARKVLEREDRPMSCGEIVQFARGLITTTGKTPDRTLYSLLVKRIAREGDESGFRKVGPGLFTLTEKTRKRTR